MSGPSLRPGAFRQATAGEAYLVAEEDFLDGKDYSFRYQSNGVVLELFED